MSITCTVESISPALAKSLLKFNTGNFRPIDKNRVAKYAKDMRDGLWALNGEAIKFNHETLLDGQHRLHAVIESGVTIKSVVVRDIDASPVTMDRGRPRTIGQWLRHEGVKNANNIAAIARMALAHEKGLWDQVSWNVQYIADHELISFADRHRTSLADAFLLCNHCKILPASILGAIVFCGSGLKAPSKNETATWFVSALSSGTGLSDTDAVLHLRNRLIEKMGVRSSVTPYMKRMLATIAWNKTVKGEPTKQLRLTLTGPAKHAAPNQIFVAEQ